MQRTPSGTNYSEEMIDATLADSFPHVSNKEET
jgi:hypothetical protein